MYAHLIANVSLNLAVTSSLLAYIKLGRFIAEFLHILDLRIQQSA